MPGTIYKTSSIIPEYRDKIPNCTKFDLCEDCNNENYEDYMNIKYYIRYKLALCDACIDCRDGHKWRNKKDYSKAKSR